MQELKSIESVQKAIKEGAVLLYVSAPNCNVCDALKIKVEELFSNEFPKIKLYEANISVVPELTGEFQIFSAPAMLIFFEGQEFAREGRNVSLELLSRRVEKVYKLYFE